MKSYTKDDPPSILSARSLMIYELKITNNINNFPKKYRHNLVDRIINTTVSLMEDIRTAYNGYDKTEKIKYINSAITKCDCLKDILPCILEALHPKISINHWNHLLDELKTQLEKWKGSLIKK